MSHEMMDLELVLEMLDKFFEQANELGDVAPDRPRKIEIYPRFGVVPPLGTNDGSAAATAGSEGSVTA